jgi:hypothetical protein
MTEYQLYITTIYFSNIWVAITYNSQNVSTFNYIVWLLDLIHDISINHYQRLYNDFRMYTYLYSVYIICDWMLMLYSIFQFLHVTILEFDALRVIPTFHYGNFVAIDYMKTWIDAGILYNSVLSCLQQKLLKVR